LATDDKKEDAATNEQNEEVNKEVEEESSSKKRPEVKALSTGRGRNSGSGEKPVIMSSTRGNQRRDKRGARKRDEMDRQLEGRRGGNRMFSQAVQGVGGGDDGRRVRGDGRRRRRVEDDFEMEERRQIIHQEDERSQRRSHQSYTSNDDNQQDEYYDEEEGEGGGESYGNEPSSLVEAMGAEKVDELFSMLIQNMANQPPYRGRGRGRGEK